MARSLGINLQPDGFAFALAEGSAKKFNLKTSGVGALDAEALDAAKGDPVRAMGKALARALKTEGAGGKVDQVVVTLPSNETVLRELSLPFSDREKVRQVLKFEVESDLYHRDIDDVICDFIEINDDRATASILVSVAPKDHVESGLDIADAAGLEPQTIELDIGALTNYIRSLPRSSREEADGLVEAYLHVGATSSALLVLGEEGVRAIRVIHLGWRELARGLMTGEADAEPLGDAPVLEQGTGPVAESLSEQNEIAGESAPSTTEIIGELDPADNSEEAVEGGEEGEEAVGLDEHEPLFGSDAALNLNINFTSVLAQASPEVRGALLRRLVSEVRRGLAAVAGAQVGRIHLLGAQLPGLDTALASRLGVPSLRLEVSERFEEADPIALGAALRGLGNTPSQMNFRQEEFRFTRGLERVEGPFTFMLVGLIAYFLVETVILIQKTKVHKNDIQNFINVSVPAVENYNKQFEDDEDMKKDWHVRTDFGHVPLKDRMGNLRAAVARKKTQLDKLVGEAGVELPQSCFKAWQLVHKLLEREMKSYSKRWMVEYFDFVSNDQRRQVDAHVMAKFGFTVFGDQLETADVFDTLIAAFKKESWVMDASSKELKAADTAGAFTGDIEVQISTTKARELGL